MTGALALAGVIVGFAIASYAIKRRDAALFDLVRSEIANTAAPTTDEIRCNHDQGPPCPRCSCPMFKVFDHPGSDEFVWGHDCEP